VTPQLKYYLESVVLAKLKARREILERMLENSSSGTDLQNIEASMSKEEIESKLADIYFNEEFLQSELNRVSHTDFPLEYITTD
jgi:hypothetical protein